MRGRYSGIDNEPLFILYEVSINVIVDVTDIVDRRRATAGRGVSKIFSGNARRLVEMACTLGACAKAGGSLLMASASCLYSYMSQGGGKRRRADKLVYAKSAHLRARHLSRPTA